MKPFISPYLKIDRAITHLNEIVAKRDEYFLANPIRLVIEEWPEVGSHVVAWRFRVAGEPPPTISLAIGDAIHNLRSALDLAVCDAVRKADKSTKGVSFPFAESAQGLEEMIKKKKVHRAGADVVILIREMQPYKGGNWGLRALHDLDVQDKHSMIIPTVAIANVDLSNLVSQVDEKTRNELRQWHSEIADGVMVAGMPRVLSPAVGTVVDADYRLCLFSINEQSGDEAVHLIQEFVRIVKNIVDYMAEAADCA